MEIQRVSSGVEFIYWWNLYNDKKPDHSAVADPCDSQLHEAGRVDEAEHATAICMLVRYLYVSAVKDMNHDKESFYQVEFTILHKKLEVCAFLDTGNFLYEPVSQMPVCILEEETFLKYFHEPLFKMIEKQEAEGIRMIPYQSVGREHGMMPAVMANDMKITKEDRIIEHKKAVIAISKVSLSKWGAYEMLLHPDLIKNGR